MPIDRSVRIYSDSNYAIKCVTEWYKKWIINNWKSSGGKDVENKDLIKPIRAIMEDRDRCNVRTEIIWIKGHAANEGNIGADKLASDAAKKAQVMRAEGVDIQDDVALGLDFEQAEKDARDAEEALEQQIHEEEEIRAYLQQ